ncbi:MAG: WS/DGAT/MGAT family O-acyltransferase [Burkholderiaceae bacterium]
MKPLSGLDALFLHLETPATPMHVGAVHLLQLPKGYRGDFVADVKRHVGKRLPLSPVFTRQLATMPLNFANPVWVRADKVDLDRHVLRVRLPRPGTQRQLEAAVARLHAKCLPRDRPLWAFHVIEGLQSGELGFYTKIHHATLDGAAGVALAHALLDITPKARKVKVVPQRPGEHPSLGDLIGTAVRTTGKQGVQIVRQLPQLARALAKLVAGGGAGFGRNLAFGPRTSFNGQIDAGRSFATASLPLDRVQKIAAAHGATINEVVLTVIGGALRGYLEAHGGVPRKSLIAAVPVSLREAGNDEATTLATMTLASLATDIADPAARLVQVRAASAAAKAVMKQLKGAVPTDVPSLGLPWLLSAAAGLYGRFGVASRLPPIANLVVSNVPGPPMPFYLAGARLKTYWPVSIVEHGVGLNITLQSYAGSLDFGLIAARSGLPNLHRLAGGLLDAFAELEAASPRTD